MIQKVRIHQTVKPKAQLLFSPLQHVLSAPNAHMIYLDTRTLITGRRSEQPGNVSAEGQFPQKEAARATELAADGQKKTRRSCIRFEQEPANDSYQTALQRQIKLPPLPPPAARRACVCARIVPARPDAAHVGGSVVKHKFADCVSGGTRL